MTITKKVKSDFYIDFNKFMDLDDKAVDWLIKSWNYQRHSTQWKLCRLRYKAYRDISKKFLVSATEYLKNG